MELRKTFRFEASHVLPKHPGKCSRLHGHSWVLHVWVEGAVDPKTGFVMDFGVISALVKPVIDKLDHTHLGQIIEGEIAGLWTIKDLPEDFYPTSENLLWWFGGVLHLPWSKLALEETCTSYAELTRKEYDDAQRLRENAR